MPAVITFPIHEERFRAIDLLADAEETYDVVAPRTYLVSDAAVKLLKTQNVRFQLLTENGRETVDAAGS